MQSMMTLYRLVKSRSPTNFHIALENLPMSQNRKNLQVKNRNEASHLAIDNAVSNDSLSTSQEQIADQFSHRGKRISDVAKSPKSGRKKLRLSNNTSITSVPTEEMAVEGPIFPRRRQSCFFEIEIRSDYE
jgi:hypothetical protein